MTISLAKGFGLVETQLIAAANWLLLFDFDGTLTPLCEYPSQARLSPHIRSVLRELEQADCVKLGLVSGRELQDLRQATELWDTVLAGNHGLEIEGPGFSFYEPTAVRRSSEIAELASELQQQLKPYSGVYVEFKKLTATVHLRQAMAGEIATVTELIRRRIHCTSNFMIRPGKLTVEIWPCVNWNKGKAVTWLQDQYQMNRDTSLMIYVGDDATDEDVFIQHKDQLPIKVGEDAATNANYLVKDVADVHAFLVWALESLRRRSSG